MKYHFKKFIGIDPGKSGGIAVLTGKTVKVYACPRTVEDMAVLMGLCLSDVSAYEVKVSVEKVWARPHDAKGSIWKFAENYGMWFGIAGAYELDLKTVSPQMWMKYFETPKLDKPRRKRYLRDKARSLYPDLKKITLKTADAILVATYAKENDNNS